MNNFIFKPNHSLNELVKIQSDYVMIREYEKHLYKCNMLNDLLAHSGFTRAVNILQDEGIETYEQLTQNSEYSLMNFDGMGKKSITSIKDFLQHNGLMLRRENAEELAIIEEQKRIASEEYKIKKAKKAKVKQAVNNRMREKALREFESEERLIQTMIANGSLPQNPTVNHLRAAGFYR